MISRRWWPFVYWSAFVLGLTVWIVAFFAVVERFSTPRNESQSQTYPCGPKVLVFHASWCHWCPTEAEINALQKQYPQYEIVDLDIDKYPEEAAKYHVTSVPRFFVCGGDGCRTTQSFDELKQWLSQLP